MPRREQYADNHRDWQLSPRGIDAVQRMHRVEVDLGIPGDEQAETPEAFPSIPAKLAVSLTHVRCCPVFFLSVGGTQDKQQRGR
jgi:hypothetical protein